MPLYHFNVTSQFARLHSKLKLSYGKSETLKVCCSDVHTAILFELYLGTTAKKSHC